MQNDSNFDLDQLILDNVTLFRTGSDPILKSVDFELPMDQTVVVESSDPQNAVNFLKFLSGSLPCRTGRILWNGQDIFSNEASLDPRHVMATCFEHQFLPTQKTLQETFMLWIDKKETESVLEEFELTELKNTKLNKLNFSELKLVYLILSVVKNPQILLLEDPATGLSEKHWLMFLDFIQFKQRRGYLRHIFMTNHHDKALNHIEHNTIYIEEGLIYIDESSPLKKVAHF